MARVRFWGREEDRGCPPIEIVPGSRATFWLAFQRETVVREFRIASLSQELHIERLIVDNQIVASDISAARYLAASRDPDVEAQLVARIRACFRYQDHTLEEYRAVLAALAPSTEVRWPVLPRNGRVEVILQNPTRAPVLASVSFRVQAIEERSLPKIESD